MDSILWGLMTFLSPLLTNLGWFIAIALLFAIFRSIWFKGIWGEFLIRVLVYIRLDKNQYHTFHNVILATPDGTTQVDHIIASRFGLFVVETKNMKGWIFGDPTQATWTQQIFKNKYKFQNPLRQNYKHTKALESLLGITSETIYSVIVFAGDSTFKTPMPKEVTYVRGFIPYIKSKTQQVLPNSQVEQVVSAIRSKKLESTFKAQREHVRNLQLREDPNSEQFCPKCGNPMVLRVSKKGKNKGSRFWGCSQFPKCRTVRNVVVRKS